MAETFSIGTALEAPFALIRRHPVSVFVWGLLMAGFGVFCAVILFGSLADVPFADMEEPPAEFMTQMVALQSLSLVINIGQWALMLFIWAAVMRATTRIGRPDRFFFLRFGATEGWLALVGVALYAGLYIAGIVLALFGFVFWMIVLQIGEVVAMVGGGLLILAFMLILAFAWARVSLIAPATVILGRLAFVEGWTLAKGRTLRLFGLMAATWLIYLVIYVCGVAIGLVVLFFSDVLPQLMAATEPQTFGDLFPTGPALWALLAVILLPGSFIGGAVWVIMTAPFVSACRQLLDGAAPRRDATPRVR